MDEIKRHPFFAGLNWSELKNTQPPFVPSLTDSRDTSYFLDRHKATYGNSMDFTERELSIIQEEGSPSVDGHNTPATTPVSPLNDKFEHLPTSPRVLNFSMVNVNALRQRSNSSPLARDSKKKKSHKKEKRSSSIKRPKRKQTAEYQHSSPSEEEREETPPKDGSGRKHPTKKSLIQPAVVSEISESEEGEGAHIVRRKDNPTTVEELKGSGKLKLFTRGGDGNQEGSGSKDATKKAEDDNAALLSELLGGLPCTGENCTVTLYIQVPFFIFVFYLFYLKINNYYLYHRWNCMSRRP